MNKVFIIAEAGVNHNGSLETAKKLVDAAKDCGVDAVKFQTFKTEINISIHAEKAEYQKLTTDSNETQFDMIKDLELNFEEFRLLRDYCNKKEILFLSTPFDFESIKLLDELGLDTLKIPSGEIINLPFLGKIGSLNKKVILSTGMGTLQEIESALEILIKNGTDKNKITVLHCNTEYPTPFEDVNLLAMLTIKNKFNVKVGYSDHTLGIEVPIAAATLGAEIIEKHFTLDRNMEGPDHLASLEPNELKQMVRAIRNIEKAIGDGIKKPSPSEIKNIQIARKSLVASRQIMVGEIFTQENVGTKRPGTGISPMKWDEVMGKNAKRNFNTDELIEL